MIQFFDINTGTIYNGDYPYIHWAEPFSVGVIRYKELFFLSDKEFVQAEIPVTDNWTFALYNPEAVTVPVEYDDNQFSDIESCACGRITLHGQAINGKYAHQLIIICRSDVEGEFIEDFRIDGLPYKIGAEFWGENESLRINLANQGTEIPELVGKAIYGADLHEDNPDWVLLNRKFRELLIQHMDVMDNKGSYKSLLNALKWFEYQDLAELREVWKFQTPDGTKYYDHPVDTFITEEAKARMFNSSKSTYFALRSLKRRIVGFENSTTIEKPIYEDTKYEHDPLEGELKTLACKWSEEEMRLKMVLLGNFFETYFMPIHTDLIRSVVEDIHASVIKVQTGTLDDVHEECYTEANDFDFEWSGGTPDNPDDTNNPNGDKKFYLREIHAYAGLPQEDSYAQAFEDAASQQSSKTYEFEYVPIIGCHELDDANVASDNPFDLMRGQLYNGIGAIVTGHFKFDENIVSGECESNQWGNFVKSTMTADGSKKEFSVNFLFPTPGDFKFIFRFVGASGKVYSRIADITITDNLVVDLEFYALVAGTDRMHETPDPFTSEPEPKYMFSRTQERNYVLEDTIYNLKDGTTIPATKLWLDKDWGQYSQFIPIREANDKTFHWQAPYMTKVRKMFFTGTKAQALCALYMSGNKIKEKCWYEMLTNESGDVQLRYCTKRRDDVMPTAPKMPGVTVVDSDVFFPELHTLMKVKGEVYHGIPIVCRPVLRFADTNEAVNYSNLITAKDFSWEFYSWGVQRNINEIPTSSDDALMSWNYAVRLPRGYYTATFRYRFGNKDVEIKKQTPFRLVNEFTPLSHA